MQGSIMCNKKKGKQTNLLSLLKTEMKQTDANIRNKLK